MADTIIPDDKARRERQRQYARDYERKHHDKLIARRRAKREANREAEREKSKQYIAANRERLRAGQKKWVSENRERVNAYHRLRRATCDIEKRREQEREWEAKHRDKKNASRRLKRAANIDTTRAVWREEAAKKRAQLRADGVKRDRSWEKKNPDKIRAMASAQKAKRKGATGKFTAKNIATIRKAQRDRCAYCRCKLNGEGHIDHIVAVAKGGTNYPNNLQLACSMCNSRKAAKDPIAFAQEMGLLI